MKSEKKPRTEARCLTQQRSGKKFEVESLGRATGQSGGVQESLAKASNQSPEWLTEILQDYFCEITSLCEQVVNSLGRSLNNDLNKLLNP